MTDHVDYRAMRAHLESLPRRRHIQNRYVVDVMADARRLLSTGLSQARVADRLGIHPKTLWRWVQKWRREG